jgi:hypothetical protein
MESENFKMKPLKSTLIGQVFEIIKHRRGFLTNLCDIPTFRQYRKSLFEIKIFQILRFKT